MRNVWYLSISALGALGVLFLAGCFNKTTREQVVPTPPVVQVNPPVVTPGTQVTTVTPAPNAQSSTTTWNNGQIVQRRSVTEEAPGEVQHQTTTTWNNTGGPPETTTTVTTSSH
jgi:uncharacterized lipoprotein YajG